MMNKNMFYQKHIFVCVNRKDQGRKCCGSENTEALADELIEQLKQKNVWGPGQIRVTKTKCLGRCEQGPSVVIYPEGEWKQLLTMTDVEGMLQAISE